MKNDTKKFVINTAFLIITQFFVILLSFIQQRVFAQNLGAQYLGLNNLFSNILSVLSISELGLATAFMSSLFEPLRRGNKETIVQTIVLFRRIYRYIGITILTLGSLINVIFIPYYYQLHGLNQSLKLGVLCFYFELYVINAVLGYFLIYIRILLIADGNSKIDSLILFGVRITITSLQIIMLFVYKSYVIYLLLMILSTLSYNVIVWFYTSRRYTWLLSSKYAVFKLSDSRFNILRTNIKQNFLIKVSDVVSKSFDTLFISISGSLNLIAIYSVNILIVNSILNIFTQLTDIVTSYIGQFENGSVNQSKAVKRLEFVFLSLSLVTGSAFNIFLPMFMTLWLNSSYVMNALNTALLAILIAIEVFKIFLNGCVNAFGLFEKISIVDVWKNIITIVITIVLFKALSTALFAVVLSCRIFGELLGVIARYLIVHHKIAN